MHRLKYVVLSWCGRTRAGVPLIAAGRCSCSGRRTRGPAALLSVILTCVGRRSASAEHSDDDVIHDADIDPVSQLAQLAAFVNLVQHAARGFDPAARLRHGAAHQVQGVEGRPGCAPGTPAS